MRTVHHKWGVCALQSLLTRRADLPTVLNLRAIKLRASRSNAVPVQSLYEKWYRGKRM